MSHHATALNLAAILDHTARLMPDRGAVTCAGRTTTYGQLEQHAQRVAAALTASGIAPGDHVALSCPNVPWFPIAYFGILKAGGVVVPLNVLLKPREVAYHLKDSRGEGAARVRRHRRIADSVDREGGLRRGRVFQPSGDDDDGGRAEPDRRGSDIERGNASGSRGSVRHPAAPDGRHRGDSLHLRHHRSPEGSGAHAREHGAECSGDARHVSAPDAGRLRTGRGAGHAAALSLDGANLSDERRNHWRHATGADAAIRCRRGARRHGARARRLLDRGADDVLGPPAARENRWGRSPAGRRAPQAVRVGRRRDAARADAELREHVRREDPRGLWALRDGSRGLFQPASPPDEARDRWSAHLRCRGEMCRRPGAIRCPR